MFLPTKNLLSGEETDIVALCKNRKAGWARDGFGEEGGLLGGGGIWDLKEAKMAAWGRIGEGVLVGGQKQRPGSEDELGVSYTGKRPVRLEGRGIGKGVKI